LIDEVSVKNFTEAFLAFIHYFKQWSSQ